MKIHRTAIVSPKAEVANDVEIGPYAVVEGAAIIGPGCIIHAHAILGGSVRMGRENVIGYGAAVGGDPQDHAFSPDVQSSVVIGDHNRIREYCTIHRGTAAGSATVVGDHNYFMAGTHLAHNTKVGNRVTLANNTLLAGYVEIQDGVYVGGGSVFHQFLRIGKLSFVQGNGTFSKDIPPFTIGAGYNRVVGLNLHGLRKAGVTPEQRREINWAFGLLYRSGLNTMQALQMASQISWSKLGREFFDFVGSAKKRGICDIRRQGNSSTFRDITKFMERVAPA